MADSVSVMSAGVNSLGSKIWPIHTFAMLFCMLKSPPDWTGVLELINIVRALYVLMDVTQTTVALECNLLARTLHLTPAVC